MRVELLGECAVVDGEHRVSGAALGGRRARMVLAALALADGPLPADHLAAAVWGDRLPASWPAALRGTVRALRTALAPVGGSGQRVVATVPVGYRLAADVEVDLRLAESAVRRAARLRAEGRPAAALDAADAVAGLRGAQLVTGEDAGWLAPHRAAVDVIARDATLVVASAASALGDHSRAITAARTAVATEPLDERAHRALIQAFERAGDRAGAVQAYATCRSVLAEELGIDPSAETVAVYLDALADQVESAPARVPVATTSFVGRAAELARVTAALSTPGLVTLVGSGGVGKSRLAAQVAAGVDVAGGRSWVSLATVAQDVLVAATVALELGLTAGLGDATDTLVGHLAPLGRALLVLDGADPVVDGTASLCVALLEACPLLTVLATSRGPLGVDGEQVVPIPPLPIPEDDGADVTANPQVQLLFDRLRSGGGELDPQTIDRPALLGLCRRCAGLPLALELAAAQLTEMSVADLLDQLDAGRGDQVRAVARSSYELLDADEASVFRRFAVVDGQVGLPFVRAVVAGSDIAPVRIVRILRELSLRGLITVERSGPRWSYGQDDDLHRFAGELLADEGGEAAAFDRLAGAIAALLPEDARTAPAGFAADVSAVLGCVRSLFGAGLAGRADLDRCLELAFRLHRYWAATSVAEGRFWLSRLLDRPGDSTWRRYATYALGYLSYWAGDTDRALADLQSAVGQFSAEADPYLARALIYLAGLFDDLDRPAEALDYVRRSIAAAEPFGTDLYVAAAMGLGSVLSERGDPQAARYADDAVQRCRLDGSAEQLAALLPTAAMVCWQVGAVDQAKRYADEAQPMHADHQRIARVVLLSTMAGLALAEHDHDAAVEHGRTADAEGTALGIEREMPLIRAIVSRALLGRGDVAAAAAPALACLETAAAMPIGFPLATALETAALVGAATGAAADDLASLLATAVGLRAAGDRPVPAPLRADVDRLIAGTPRTSPVPAGRATEIARRVLYRPAG